MGCPSSQTLTSEPSSTDSSLLDILHHHPPPHHSPLSQSPFRAPLVSTLTPSHIHPSPLHHSTLTPRLHVNKPCSGGQGRGRRGRKSSSAQPPNDSTTVESHDQPRVSPDPLSESHDLSVLSDMGHWDELAQR